MASGDRTNPIGQGDDGETEGQGDAQLADMVSTQNRRAAAKYN